MDIKIQGITKDIMHAALIQAHEGRMHILQIMKQALPSTREDISVHAPRIIRIKINPEKIRDVIGKGGAVIFEVKPILNSLSHFRPNQSFAADPGINGGGSQMTGRGGKDLIVHVPPGTVIYDAETSDLLGDLTENGQQMKGGTGGGGDRDADRNVPFGGS